MRELRRRDGEGMHELRPKRHHDHEIQDVGELHRPEDEQRGAFAAQAQLVVLVGGGHKR